MIDIISSMVTPIFGADSGVESKQFLMVSHFESMSKALGTFHGFYFPFNFI
jgi:hypothetical protein